MTTALSIPSKCAWCEGSGKWNVAPGNVASCIVCGGKGAVNAGVSPVECQQCGGRGRANTVTPCLQCAGTGWETYPAKKL
ncbi:MAG: hypothetical protein IPN69_00605 [Acidobacteria bacterium]|nr:hypothetical protein [Acidobacteriota bacterium]MBK8149836.1 hypothetical protein [Acidobacteriota bacterium]MBK8809220.1 hypothetical protein [Acidobacteriota bacterium]